MNAAKLLFFANCAVLFVVPLFFVVHKVYKDGVVGRGSLLGISFVSGTFLGEAMFGNMHVATAQEAWLTTSFTVFLCWHLWRFHRRVLLRSSEPKLSGHHWVP